MMSVDMKICAHFGLCGGCSRQNISYAEQLAVKENIVRTHLEKFEVRTFHPILPSPDQFYYRNKMEFSFGNEKDLKILSSIPHPVLRTSLSTEWRGTEGEARAHLGLHPKGRFALVTPTPGCLLLSEESQRICAVVEEWATSNGVSVYVRKSNQGDLRHLVVREGKSTNERLVNLIAKSTTPHIDSLAEALKKSGLNITTFLWTAYDGLSDVAGGDDHRVYWGDGAIQEKIGDLRFKVTPGSFMQTNTHAAEMMIGVLRRWIHSSKTLIDLYCGSGAIGLSLAKDFEQVIGVEINRSAIHDAEQNKLVNHIVNARFIEGKAEDVAPGLPVGPDAANTVVVVDPPRAGLHPKMVETLLSWLVPNLFYVSCNPESLARDLRALSARYDILDVQPMDFFPHTDHIETAIRLSLRGRHVAATISYINS